MYVHVCHLRVYSYRSVHADPDSDPDSDPKADHNNDGHAPDFLDTNVQDADRNDTGSQQTSESQQAGGPDSAASDQQQAPASKAPRTGVVNKELGYNGFFADAEQQTKLPYEVLESLLPCEDGSVLVKASPLTIEKGLEGK